MKQLPKVNRTIALTIAKLAARGQTGQLIDTCEALIATLTPSPRGWHGQLAKLTQWLKAGMPADVPFPIFHVSNSKLPFHHFSALPLVTCPGMGACSQFCYSLKSWRYPAAFLRQVQNTLLLVADVSTIAKAWNALPLNATVRLYVDGDFDSMATLGFWMSACASRPDLSVYGYSKSWHLFLAYAKAHSFPANYRLNLSSGSRFAQMPAIVQAMAQLPVARGQFVAVPVPKAVTGDARAYRRAVLASAREQGLSRVFVCPGDCGACTSRGHACGLDNFRGINIAIGIH